jgi:hypothetical protein
MFIETSTADGGTVLLAAGTITTALRKSGTAAGKESVTVHFVGGPPYTIELDPADADTLWQRLKDGLDASAGRRTSPARSDS